MLCENIATNLQETVTVIRIGLLYLLGLNGFNYPLLTDIRLVNNDACGPWKHARVGLKMCGLCGGVIPRERKLLMKLFLVVRYGGIHRFYVMDKVEYQHWEHLPCYRRQKIIFVGCFEEPGETGGYLF